MSCEEEDEGAVAKAWRTPEVVEKFLDFLDGRSIVRLARCHDLTKDLLKRPSVWPKVVRRVCPVRMNPPWDEEAFVATNKIEMLPLLLLLKMTKNPAEMKLTLLEVICERFTPVTEMDRNMGPDSYEQYVKVRFSCSHNDHLVSAAGFLLLEEVELACGSSPNLKIEEFDLSELEGPMLSALGRRVSKQKEPLKEVQVWAPGFGGGTIRCKTTRKAEHLLTIVKASEETSFECLIIVGDVKKEGWAALGKVAELYGGGAGWRTFNVICSRQHMLQAEREDLRKIWEAMWEGEWGNYYQVTHRSSRFFLADEDDGLFRKEEGDWDRFMQVLDMSQKDWDDIFMTDDWSSVDESEDEESDEDWIEEEDEDGDNPASDGDSLHEEKPE